MKFLHISCHWYHQGNTLYKVGFHHGIALGSLSFFPSNWQVKGPDILGGSLGIGRGALRLLS